VAVGLLLSAMAAPALASQLYGVRPIDPTVFLLVPLVLSRWRSPPASSRPPASKVDPIIVLHEG